MTDTSVLQFVGLFAVVLVGMGSIPLLYKGRDRQAFLRLMAGLAPDTDTQTNQADSAHDAQLELERMRIAERREIREQHERLLREKFDVLKTAVAMGYGEQQLAELDARLAQHIGDEGLRQLLDGELPAADLTAPKRTRGLGRKPVQIG